MKHERKKSKGRNRHTLLLPVFLVAVVALIVSAAAADSWAHGKKHKKHKRHKIQKVELEDSTIIIETNATDGDAGFQIFLDGEGWRHISVYDPNGRQIFDVETEGGVKKIGGGTELFLETAEPEFETPEELQEILDLLRPGKYRFYGWTVEGDLLYGKARLTHNIPCAPELVEPAEVDLEEDAPETVEEPVMISWEPVEGQLGPDPENEEEVGCTDEEVEIIGYEVIVDDEEGHTFDVTVPQGTTSITVPDEFTEPSAAHKFEVLAIEESGNQTIVESFFCTEGLEGDECREAALDLE
jgi:hypothetical protein